MTISKPRTGTRLSLNAELTDLVERTTFESLARYRPDLRSRGSGKEPIKPPPRKKESLEQPIYVAAAELPNPPIIPRNWSVWIARRIAGINISNSNIVKSNLIVAIQWKVQNAEKFSSQKWIFYACEEILKILL